MNHDHLKGNEMTFVPRTIEPVLWMRQASFALPSPSVTRSSALKLKLTGDWGRSVTPCGEHFALSAGDFAGFPFQHGTHHPAPWLRRSLLFDLCSQHNKSEK